jgi:hypothetical protein
MKKIIIYVILLLTYLPTFTMEKDENSEATQTVSKEELLLLEQKALVLRKEALKKKVEGHTEEAKKIDQIVQVVDKYTDEIRRTTNIQEASETITSNVTATSTENSKASLLSSIELLHSRTQEAQEEAIQIELHMPRDVPVPSSTLFPLLFKPFFNFSVPIKNPNQSKNNNKK